MYASSILVTDREELLTMSVVPKRAKHHGCVQPAVTLPFVVLVLVRVSDPVYQHRVGRALDWGNGFNTVSHADSKTSVQAPMHVGDDDALRVDHRMVSRSFADNPALFRDEPSQVGRLPSKHLDELSDDVPCCWEGQVAESPEGNVFPAVLKAADQHAAAPSHVDIPSAMV